MKYKSVQTGASFVSSQIGLLVDPRQTSQNFSDQIPFRKDNLCEFYLNMNSGRRTMRARITDSRCSCEPLPLFASHLFIGDGLPKKNWIAGVITSDKTIETRIPPITAIASGCSICDPAPSAKASGSIPATAARAVITIGRNRRRPA